MTIADSSDQVRIVLNGEETTIAVGAVPDVLCALGYDPEQQGIAIAINAAVVPRSEWGATRIADGDRVELVGAKQGG